LVAGDGELRTIHLEICPAEAPELGAHVLYVEQAAAEARDKLLAAAVTGAGPTNRTRNEGRGAARGGAGAPPVRRADVWIPAGALARPRVADDDTGDRRAGLRRRG
jgi:hypothetical protein